MRAGIFAAGVGSRFVQAGWSTPKPLIPLLGKPLIRHVLERLLQAGIEEVDLLLNERAAFDAVEAYVDRLPAGFRVRTWRKTTRSSYESFRYLMDRLGPPPYLLCTVDTIFPVEALKAFLRAEAYPAPCRLVLGVTDFVHDEKPLWVETDEAGEVLRLGPSARPQGRATAGLYLVRRELTELVRTRPFDALRDFLAALVERGDRVWAQAFPTVLDIDSPGDLRVAESLLGASQHGAPA